MNNKYLIFLRNVLLSGLAIVVLTLFSSCENFLRGNDVKSQLEELIAYENALTHQLIVRSAPAMGSFLSEGEKPCKLGFTTDLQFTMNTEDYVFHGFEAVCVNDTTQTRADCVEFKINEAESDPSKGIYKVTVKLLKAADDILIRPVCVLIPAVVLYEPESKSPNYLNTPIVIHFNQAMDPLNVLEKDDQNNYKNISLEYLGDDIINLFETPYFDSSKSILTITPKGGQLLEYLKDERFAYFDFDIFLKNICLLKSLDGKDYNLALKSNNTSDYSFSIRYKYAVEEVKPIQYEFLATRQEITLNNVSQLAEEDEFIYGELDATSQGESEKIFHNRTNGIIYIYGKYYDAESGVRAVKVEEHRFYDSRGYFVVNAKGEEDKEIIYSIRAENENAIWIDSNDGYVTFLIKHKLQSFNGAIDVNVSVMDGAGNHQAQKNANGKDVNQTFTVFKKDGSEYLDREQYWSVLYNGGCINDFDNSYLLEKYSSSVSFNLNEYNEKIREFYLITRNDSYGLCQLYNDVQYSPSDILIQCKFINSNKKEDIQELNYIYYDDENYYWKGILDIEKIGGSKLTLIVSDDIGNKLEYEYRIPKANDFTYVPQNDAVQFFSSSEYQVNGLIYVDNNNTANYYVHSYRNPEAINISLNNNCKICPKFDLYYGQFFVEMSDVDYNSTATSETEDLSLGNCSVTVKQAEHDSSGLLTVFTNIPEDSWTKFDSIYADFSKDFYVPEYASDGRRIYFSKGQYTNTNYFDNSILYDEDEPVSCTFYGIKDRVCLASMPVVIQSVSGPDYDNTPPEYAITGFSYSNQKITFTNIDDNSGPGESFILINGQKYDFTDQLEINLKDINLTPQGTFTYEVYVYDSVGNFFIDEPLSFNAQQAAITKIAKQSDSTWNLTCASPDKNKKLYIYTLDSNGSWADPIVQNMTINNYFNSGYKKITLADNKIIKIIHTSSNEGSFSYPAYFYTGAASDGVHDMVLPHGNSTSIVTVKSNQPVFVNTVVTDMDYDICKDWTAEQWEFCHDTFGNKYMDFTTAPLVDQKYEIPVNAITSGQCYVVIAHFANGKSDMSDVMVKP